MSVNYHAFQSRGVLFDEYEKVSEQWREAFTGYDPERIARILKLQRDETYLYLSYLGTPYRLCLENGRLSGKKEGLWTEALYFNESMAIYHLLQYTKDAPVLTGSWVASSTIDGVVSRDSRMPDPLLMPFAKRWEGRAEELEEACVRIGGERIPKGDRAFQFEVFPGIGMQLIFWDADEDFEARVQILVDRQITDFVHYETVGCMISDLMEKIEG
ncbi:MAG: DUF3786 domain-containing protein [Candidatus Limivivens sp.]|nr:DUF3786 domain-containing protein [Candidatus Limivivens sp.]